MICRFLYEAQCCLTRPRWLLGIVLSAGVHPADDHRAANDRADNAKRDIGRDFVDVQQQHFRTDEQQNDRQTVFEQVKTLVPVSQQEVQRAQAHDRKNIRGEHDERIGGDCENRWNAVHCEDQI